MYFCVRVISLTVTYFVTSYHGDERRINEQRFNKFLTVSVLETGCGDNFRFSGTKVYITRCRNYNNNLTSVYKNLKILKILAYSHERKVNLPLLDAVSFPLTSELVGLLDISVPASSISNIF